MTGIETSVILRPDLVYEARAVVADLLRTEAGLSAMEVGRILERSAGAVRHATRTRAPQQCSADLIAQVRAEIASSSEDIDEEPSHPKAASGLLYGLQAARAAAGMTKKELGAKVGVPRETISRRPPVSRHSRR